MRLIALLLGYVLGIVLLWAALSKITDLNSFAQAMANVAVIPAWLRLPAALGIPAIELTLAFGLFCGYARRETLVLTAGLLSGFLLWQVYVAAKGGKVGSCHCFTWGGKPEDLRPALRVIRGMIFCAMAFTALYLDKSRARSNRASSPPAAAT